jgi:S1-C subfamily serine protease
MIVKRKSFVSSPLVLAIVVLLMATLGCSLGGFLADASPSPSPTPIVVVLTPTPVSPSVFAEASAAQQTAVNIYKRVSPSVVHIAVEADNVLESGTGSGFVYNRQGHIVTNNHVVAQGRNIVVTFSDDTRAAAEVVGADPDSDLAVIKVDVPEALLGPVELGDSDNLQVGEQAIAIGNPFGFERTMTVGVISSLGRVVPRDNNGAYRFSIASLIQTDAAVNPGNSGGPLIDIQGRVIGVNSFIFSETGVSSGVGFAIPVNTVKRIVPDLIAKGRYAHPWLGISGQDIDNLLADGLTLPVERGVLVQSAFQDSPAGQAGLRGGSQEMEVEGTFRVVRIGGDIIVGIDGQTVGGMDDLITYLETRRVGDQVVLTIVRDSQEQEIAITLEERPDS